jgi:lipid-binding SYLF domain-containing protein
MSRVLPLLAALAACGLALPRPARAADDPHETIRQSQQVLAELVAMPGKQIPHRLLADAQGVAIVPRVLKVGFVAGLRRGHGVVLIRDAGGGWQLPQFITLTGGSLGWQAGVQGADVVLVFTTRKSVEGLMKGKFTIGADASAAAGPVGRNAAAATDAKLSAEIYSYSRARGLFLGVSLDGSSLAVDDAKHVQFYGALPAQPPTQIPEAAVQLLQYLVTLTGNGPGAPGVIQAAATGPVLEGAAGAPLNLEARRQSLAQHATQLFALLPADWQKYLALPSEVFDPAAAPNPASLAAVEQRYAQVAAKPEYRELASRPEFQAAHQSLNEYAAAASSSSAPPPTLQLPQPPPQ